MRLCDCSPVSCHPYCGNFSYAQYGVQSNPASGSNLPMITLFQDGNQITLNHDTITLSAGYLYLIDFIFLATTESNSYMQITPKINGILKLSYSTFAPSGAQERNTSASGSFTTNAAIQNDATLSFHLTYPESVRNIDISGAVSVTTLHKINRHKC